MHIIIDNLFIQYRRMGKGDVILLLHGWGQSSETFKYLQESLSRQYDVVAVDLPGFGGSQKPNLDWDVELYSHFVEKFLKKLKIEPFVMVGHSFGGRILIKGVGEGMLKSSKVVLIGSAGVKPSKSMTQKLLENFSRISKKVPGTQKMRSMVGKKLASRDYRQSGDLKNIFLKVINEDLRYSAKKIVIPTLLIWGCNDDQTPVRDGRLLNDLIKNSHLKTYENAGHFVYLEEKEAVLNDIREFIA